MSRFFPRIFAVIWLAATLTGAVGTAVDVFANPRSREEERHRLEVTALRLEAIEAMKQAASGERPTDRLEEFQARTGAAIYLFRDDGTVFSPKTPPGPVREVALAVRERGEIEEERQNATLVGLSLPNEHYVAVGRVRRTPVWARLLGEDQPALRVMLLLASSALLAFFLARYLVTPIRSLRRATQRIAEGDLSVRVEPELGGGVLTELASDFDTMAQRVEDLLASQQRLLSDVSHELNSPLARLTVALELARRRSDGSDAEMLDRIEREAGRLGALVDEILTFSRLEGKGPERARLDLAALVHAVVHDAEFEATPLDVEVQATRVDEATLLADAELISRAVDNVIRNALRFTASGTTVDVSLERGSREVVLAVRDHGPGVPDDALDAIFDPLFRVESDRGRSRGGTGLGLAIVKRAVELHDGTVRARNVDGGGLRVELSFPLPAKPAQPARKPG
ncbi:MAG: sensor histidine kinase [Sandaracinaceae bacterium]